MTLIARGYGKNQKIITRGFYSSEPIISRYREVLRVFSFITKAVNFKSWLK